MYILHNPLGHKNTRRAARSQRRSRGIDVKGEARLRLLSAGGVNVLNAGRLQRQLEHRSDKLSTFCSCGLLMWDVAALGLTLIAAYWV
eukprot:961579-Pyramimonas_sp.AAC.1